MAKVNNRMAEFEDEDDLPPLVPLTETATAQTVKPAVSKPAASDTNIAQKLTKIDAHMQEQEEKKQDLEKKKNTQKQVNFRLTEEEFEKYSKLFGGQGVSFSKAIRMWLDFGYDAIQSGKYEMSPYGIKEKILKSL